MTVFTPPPAAPKRRRPSGGKETVGIRQDAFVERQKHKGLRRVAVWVPIEAQTKIRETAAALRAAAQSEKAMYSSEQLARTIEMAMESAYQESSVDEDVHFDVRVSQERGLYTVLRELADGGRVLWSTVEGAGVPSEIAERIISEEQDRSEIEAIGA